MEIDKVRLDYEACPSGDCTNSIQNSVHSRRNRTRLEIMAGILTVASEGARKTRIMYQANLSFTQLQQYLEYLIQRGLIRKTENTDIYYQTTERGSQFLKSYHQLRQQL